MIQLVYVSTAVEDFSTEELVELLRKARQKNEKLGITGMLLYKNREFMQALEGEEDVVLELANLIKEDPRHRDARVILKGPAKRREFPDWTMGFRNLDDDAIEQLEGFSTFIDSPLRSHTFKDDPALCRNFLMLFKTKPERLVINSR
jgi:hypothetical protein